MPDGMNFSFGDNVNVAPIDFNQESANNLAEMQDNYFKMSADTFAAENNHLEADKEN